LQTAQKELADAVKTLGERIGDIQAEMRELKAEVKLRKSP
jgi:uncharacterized small protein (DUF1192 family)